ncbi:hypothetical protein WJX72_011184 [[Myrmecia] bisecta]|uniref:Crossover junction endonuclease MUS81 n=1 Tax=[Myrmecia] bisecta TaxID=41462 RepID=A0AAW1QGD1_9CHLO
MDNDPGPGRHEHGDHCASPCWAFTEDQRAAGISGTGLLMPMGELVEKARSLCEPQLRRQFKTFQEIEAKIRCPAWAQTTSLISLGLIKLRKRGSVGNGKVYELLPLGEEHAKRLREQSLQGGAPAGPLYSHQFAEDTLGVVLLIDAREGGGAVHNLGDKCRDLERLGVRFATRHLPTGLGDYVFVERRQTATGIEEFLLPYIIERKELHDLALSIKDGRWIGVGGCTNVGYFTMPEVDTALDQLDRRGFVVASTHNWQETARKPQAAAQKLEQDLAGAQSLARSTVLLAHAVHAGNSASAAASSSRASGDKLVVIMRGIPGSGKSTEAAAIDRRAGQVGLSMSIHSANDYWMEMDADNSLVYNFVRERLQEVHEATRTAFEHALRRGQDVIISDNTNIEDSAMEPYLELAAAHGRRVVLVDMELIPLDLAMRNVDSATGNGHGVPLNTMGRFYRTFEPMTAERLQRLWAGASLTLDQPTAAAPVLLSCKWGQSVVWQALRHVGRHLDTALPCSPSFLSRTDAEDTLPAPPEEEEPHPACAAVTITQTRQSLQPRTREFDSYPGSSEPQANANGSGSQSNAPPSSAAGTAASKPPSKAGDMEGAYDTSAADNAREQPYRPRPGTCNFALQVAMDIGLKKPEGERRVAFTKDALMLAAEETGIHGGSLFAPARNEGRVWYDGWASVNKHLISPAPPREPLLRMFSGRRVGNEAGGLQYQLTEAGQRLAAELHLQAHTCDPCQCCCDMVLDSTRGELRWED